MLSNVGNGLFHRDLVAAAAPGEILSNRGPRLHDWWYKSPPPPDPGFELEDIPIEPDEDVIRDYPVEAGEYRGIVFRQFNMWWSKQIEADAAQAKVAKECKAMALDLQTAKEHAAIRAIIAENPRASSAWSDLLKGFEHE